jgi:hypothetical protein
MQKLGIYSTHLHADTNPGAPGKGSGPTWAPTDFDHLKLPSGALLGKLNNEQLRSELLRLNVPGAATDGRHIIAERYGALLMEIHDKAGEAAIAAFLESKRG